MIHLENASKVYHSGQQEVRALDDITLSVERGQYVAVRGPSGCGKSTLLALIGGLALPSSGRVIVAEQEISAMSSAQRASFRAAQIGFVFQMFHLLPYLTVLENVLIAAGSAPSSLACERADAMLERFGLSDRRGHRPAQLSAGERQRVAMARALLPGPQLILADEPTGNLDPASADRVLELLDEFNRSGGTIVLVTHDDRAAACARRTVLLQAGKLQPATWTSVSS